MSTCIYAVNVTGLNNDELYNAAYGIVTEERRKKINSLCVKSDRILSMGAELLLIYGLRQQGIDIKETEYRYNEYGKPYLYHGGQKLHFNLSHSGDMAVCAFSSMEVGCDIERISDIKIKIAERFFGAEEYNLIEKEADESGRRDMFYRLWTLKESFIKAAGTGMSLSFKSFCVLPSFKGTVRHNFNEETYYYQEIDICSGYKCSVCGLDCEIAGAAGVRSQTVALSGLLEK